MFSGTVFLAPVLVLVLSCAFHSSEGVSFVIPGTKWCGPGNIANSYDDLGTEQELDMCCRAHDNCKESIPPEQEAHDLKNNGMFPIFSCACETAFRNCLTALANYHSLAVGRMYFNSQKVCFAYGHPIVSCRETQEHIFEKRCISYHVDKGRSQRWQFYDLALYTHVTKDSGEES
ncbi:hypothetical protein KR038_011265 [Drosophila bunnanda]|nr:hypothetical protein KR038_011265 [Drosophila bunnanda]